VSWKESTITKMMKSCFDGTAFSSFIICISQSPANSGESHLALKFGESSSKLKTNVTKPTPYKIEAKIKEFTTLVGELEKKCKSAND